MFPCLLAPLAVFALAQAGSQAAPPPRDPVPRTVATPFTGSGVIRGRVTDRVGGQPLGRVTVRLASLRSGPSPLASPISTRTDADGRYEFTRLAPGSYVVSFEPEEFTATHLRSSFGATRPADPMTGGPRPKPVELKTGETFEADAALWRALAIEGRVLNDFGQPMANIQVAVGAWDLGPRMMNSRATDDRGHFRVFGLAPGAYRVCAMPRLGMEMRGDAAEPERPLRTCYPASLGDDGAQPVTLGESDLIGVDIRIQRGRVFTVAGIALDSAGAPLVGGSVNLVRLENNGSSSSGIEYNNGHFVSRGLPPGDYAIRAEVGSPFNPQDKREREVGYVPFRIDNADVEGLVVQTGKAGRVTGRVIFEDGAPANLSSPMRITVRPDSGPSMMMGPPPNVTVNPDLTFALEGLFGPLSLQVMGLPRSWIVKAIRYKGEDIFARLVDFRGPRNEVEVVLSSRAAVLSGTVDLPASDGPPDVMILMFPADPALRRPLGGTMFTTAPKDGKFEFPPTRGGDYIVVAASSEIVRRVMSSGPTPQLERLVKAGERITLAEGERKGVGLGLAEIK
jgi:Carboxypeptidase regulatory-like domain